MGHGKEGQSKNILIRILKLSTNRHGCFISLNILGKVFLVARGVNVKSKGEDVVVAWFVEILRQMDGRFVSYDSGSGSASRDKRMLELGLSHLFPEGALS